MIRWPQSSHLWCCQGTKGWGLIHRLGTVYQEAFSCLILPTLPRGCCLPGVLGVHARAAWCRYLMMPPLQTMLQIRCCWMRAFACHQMRAFACHPVSEKFLEMGKELLYCQCSQPQASVLGWHFEFWAAPRGLGVEVGEKKVQT